MLELETSVKERCLHAACMEYYNENKRLIAPLAGFPGCDIVGCSIKLAQQNTNMHFRCIEAIKDRFFPDMSLMMMDLSVEANALGLPVKFPLNESSTVKEHPIRTVQDLEQFKKVVILDDSRIRSYLKVVNMMSREFDKLNCAYVAGPLTLAGLLAGAEDIAIDSVMNPQKLEAIVEFSTSVITTYANALVESGADCICILEPTGVIFSPDLFRQFSAKYVRQISDSYRHHGVETIYHICGNSTHLIDAMVSANVGGISLDSPQTGIDLVSIIQKVPQEVVIIGNVNPTAVMKDADPDTVYETTKELIDSMADYPNFILSTGCDLPPGTPLENIEAFMQAGRNM
jgi:uroporphyrinogen decarboxylase